MKNILYILTFVSAISCKEKYVSPVDSPVTGYLVVEGVVNNGLGNTNIRLTRTSKLGDETIYYEKNAQVRIEGENNSAHILTEKTIGNYSVENLNFPNNQKYRLRIKTTGGKEFVSDFVEVKKNPPIDSISWLQENDGSLQLYINTHDDLNNTHYYQWEYTETWEFHSSYRSSLKFQYIPTTGRDNPIASAVYRDSTTFSYDSTIVKCWQSNSSTAILLGSTLALEKDKVYLPLLQIPAKSWKLGVLYSVLVTQFAWFKDGFGFQEKMRKNTEVTGSIFDPQPSALKGNIHNVSDPEEPVVGYFNICNIEQKRLWINRAQVPGWGYFPDCNEITVPNISDSIKGYVNSILPTNVITGAPGGGIISFGAAPPDCVDCTLRGTNVKPKFWL